ncbi:VOC family protein [Leucobacter soli]|uniref:VOC domain-containing protein n=1 Tax=Leucobacter soli TaxID=2812850 RepID=A0A916NGT4_9MICO|nr:VOC family protein [Leucobacter soli]CAG7604856.1 hypothetical protein LEUCIP111803_00771 [Leucobacter soli]
MSRSIDVARHMFTLDCPDAPALAEFYGRLLGWRVVLSEGWAEVLPASGTGGISFQQVEEYVAPDWPEATVPQQGHLDFYVESLPDALEFADSIGAVRHAHQPGGEGGFVVYLDPAGHLFCLCRK